MTRPAPSTASIGTGSPDLGGPSLTLGGITLPRALFWIVIAYVLAATVIAFVIGRPLIQLSYLNELRNAGFRYALQPANQIEFEDAHVIHNGGALYPELYTVERFFHRSG